MKKNILFFISIVIFTVIGATQSFAQIEGKWKVNVEKSKAAIYESEDFKKLKEEAKTDSSARFTLGFMEGVFAAMERTVLEYKKGGEYIETTTTNNEYVQNQVKIKKGTWKFDAKKKTLLTVMENGRKEETIVKSYSKDELVLEARENGLIYLVLVE